MKVICTQENLKNGLLTVSRIISSNNTLPILNNILIKTENGLLKLSSTNLEIAVTTHIRCKIEQEGELTVFAKTITELINNFPNQNISLENTDNQLKIETENYHTVIKTLPAEEFPLIPALEKKEFLNLDAQELKKSLDQVVFAASTNQTQPEISGILLETEGKTLKVVGTDRYRLAEKKILLKNPSATSQQVILPSRTVLEFSRIISGQTGEVELAFTETQAQLKFNNTEVISRLVDGQYPDYKQIIPENFTTKIITDKQPLISALKATGIFSQATNSVKFDYQTEKQTLLLVTESEGLGRSDVGLNAAVEGKSGSVILNYRYILDCLASINTEKVVIKIIDDSSPSLFVPDGQDDYLYLVMPIKS